MRFKRGSIVEVLRKDELPSGSWCCAEVVCRNGHNYTVQYIFDTCLSDEAMIERVSRKLIRPSPPSVKLLENWVPGDVLEVYLNFSWKMATVCKALGANDFVVRLVGFLHEFKVCRSDLRARQSWQDGEWFVIGKNIGNFEEGRRRERSLRNYNPQLSSRITRAERMMSHHNGFSPIIALGNRKRGISYAHSEIEMPEETVRKFKIIEKEGSRYRLPEKVVTIAPRQENLGEKHLYTSLNNRKSQFTNLVMERENLHGRSCEIRLNQNDEDSITCSVGSCSITSNDFYKPRSYFSEGPIDAECSDAESVCYGDYDEVNILPTQMEHAHEIRRLELHAYHCTMEALHACGPLSWEQETMVTNLRLSLNISNDEHLMELRNLASTATSLSFR